MDINLTSDAASFGLLAPLMVIGALAFVVLLWDVLVKPQGKGSLMAISIAGLGVAAALLLSQWGSVGDSGRAIFNGAVSVDRFSIFFNLLFVVGTALVLFISRDYLEREEIHVGEYYALILFTLFGMMVLAMASDLIMIFIGIEVMSIAVYVLAAFNRSHYRSIEGALKYFILGSFATAFLLYGSSMIYGQTGTTVLDGIQKAMGSAAGKGLMPIAVGLILVGFAFKVAAVPFHMWAPDVYEGAATPVTAAMATGVKAAAFAAMIRTFVALAGASDYSHHIIWVVSALTIVVGNLSAIRQTNLKRMLAYSGVGHSGYLMAGLLTIDNHSLSSAGMSAMLFYLTSYVFMNLGVFAIILMLGRKEQEPVHFEDWAGMGFRHPWLAAAMTLFLLSLGGLPPTAGFMGKFYLFSSVLDAGYTNLVVIAVLTSAASFYYYLRLVVFMYMHPDADRFSASSSPLSSVVITVAVAAVILLGILPSGPVSLIEWARASVASLG